MKTIAEELISEYGIPTKNRDGNDIKSDILDAMMEFAKKMCELQKAECGNEQEGTTEYERCINAKNVCE
jgi:hypothetical protein